MRNVLVGFAIALAAPLVFAAGPPMRKPLDAGQRSAVLTLMKAADAAQQSGVAGGGLRWESVTLKSTNGRVYVPFRVMLNAPADAIKSGALLVRAVSRKNGSPLLGEQSALRPWVEQPSRKSEASMQAMILAPGEMPVGGPAVSSGRQAIQMAAGSHAALELQGRAYEKEKALAETARLVFPFEEYYFFDFRNARAGDARVIERALALLPGEYDLYVGVVDRAQKGSVPAVLKQTVTIPDFWNDRLVLSPLMLVRDVRTLKAPLPPQEQAEHPYTFGQAELVPVSSPSFTPDDPFSVVYQICNYGAPDSDLRAEYSFYRDGDAGLRLFNRTAPQQFSDADLPPPQPWTNQAFAMQSVSLKSFPPGRYELEVIVRDRLTQATATGTVAFTVAVR